MFGGIRIKASKPTARKLPSNSRFSFIRNFTDRCYRDPYRWGLVTGIAFFLVSVLTARTFGELNILPDAGPAPSNPGWN